MDSTSPTAVAEELGTSVPRVLRAARRLGLAPEDGSTAPPRLSTRDVDALRRRLGVQARIDGLTTPQVRALAALSRAPLGLRSLRAVARAAGLSPTAASRAVRVLVDQGLVQLRRQTVAEGRARETDVIHANRTHPRWPELAPMLARVQPPKRELDAEPPHRLPRRIGHLFWNAPLARIDLRTDGAYVARRVLLHGDAPALAWAATALTAADWRAAASGRGIDARSRALAENLAAAADR